MCRRNAIKLNTFVKMCCARISFSTPICQPFILSAEHDHVTRALAACHSLTLIDGQVTGDPLEATLFSTTGWV